jgi:hypothetical protein
MARDISALGQLCRSQRRPLRGDHLSFMDHERAATFWVIAAVGGGVLLSNLLKLV